MPSSPKPAIKRFATTVRRRIRRVFGRDDKQVPTLSPSPSPSSPPPSTSPLPPFSLSSSVTLPLSEGNPGDIVHSDSSSSVETPLAQSHLSESVGETLFASLDIKEEAPPSPLPSAPPPAFVEVDEKFGLPDDLEILKPTTISDGVDIPVEVASFQKEPVTDQDMESPATFSVPPADPSMTMDTEVTVEEPDPQPSHLLSETPDPNSFLIDDPDDPLSDDEHTTPVLLTHEHPSELSIASAEISLAQSQSHDLPQLPAEVSSPLFSANIYKDVPAPPPPTSGDEEEEEEQEQVPELYLPGLIIPTMFLPIPNTDSLTTLLAKYIFPPERRPVRDITGDWQHNDFNTLVMTNSWRALAKMARDRIVSNKPDELSSILSLWYLRLACLARLRLFNQTSAECTNLFVVLNAVEPASTREYLFDRIVPFELDVLHARLKYWAGDHMAYLDALSALLKRSKTKARSAPKSDVASLAMWRERGARICLMIASQLTEMKDFIGATKILEDLCAQQFSGASSSSSSSSPALRSAIARVHLQSGNISMAAKQFAVVDADPNADAALKGMNAALMTSAEGNWVAASEILRQVIDEDAENYVAINNLSVTLLSQGKLSEGIATLESALKTSPSSVVVAEPFLFNLSTLYELHSATAAEKKRNLLLEVAKWSGDGLRTTCLKMPTS